MTDFALNPVVETVRDALNDHARSVAARGPCAWRLDGGNGAALPATAAIEDGWLRLDAVLGDPPPPGKARAGWLWEHAGWNATLQGARVLLTPEGRLAARAEIPTDDGVDLPPRIEQALAGLREAADRWRGEGRDEPPAAGADEPPATAEAADELRALCDAAGWPLETGASGRLWVGLNVGNGYYQAALRPGPGPWTVAVELCSADTLAPVSRRAWGLFLLTASGLVRLVRATAGDRNGRVAARLAATWPGSPGSVELGHALAACSVACRLCGKEVNALCDPSVATDYLAVRGWAV